MLHRYCFSQILILSSRVLFTLAVRLSFTSDQTVMVFFKLKLFVHPVHRIGRTGRSGKKGMATTFVNRRAGTLLFYIIAKICFYQLERYFMCHCLFNALTSER